MLKVNIKYNSNKITQCCILYKNQWFDLHCNDWCLYVAFGWDGLGNVTKWYILPVSWMQIWLGNYLQLCFLERSELNYYIFWQNNFLKAELARLLCNFVYVYIVVPLINPQRYCNLPEIIGFPSKWAGFWQKKEPSK